MERSSSESMFVAHSTQPKAKDRHYQIPELLYVVSGGPKPNVTWGWPSFPCKVRYLAPSSSRQPWPRDHLTPRNPRQWEHEGTHRLSYGTGKHRGKVSLIIRAKPVQVAYRVLRNHAGVGHTIRNGFRYRVYLSHVVIRLNFYIGTDSASAYIAYLLVILGLTGINGSRISVHIRPRIRSWIVGFYAVSKCITTVVAVAVRVTHGTRWDNAIARSVTNLVGSGHNGLAR